MPVMRRISLFRLLVVLLLGGVTFGQTDSVRKSSSGALRIELRASSLQVRMADEIGVSVFFRSPTKLRPSGMLSGGVAQPD